MYIELNLPLYINFIDFKVSVGSINRDFIWKAFEYHGLPNKYINIFQGTGQGDVQGPPIFNVLINWGLFLVV